MYPYRAFLSYSFAERDLATHVVDVLSEVGLHVLWDHVLGCDRSIPKSHVA
jgi:hypothetical protein